MTAVLPPDLETWLCAYLRGELKPSFGKILVHIREPDDYDGSFPLVVVRDDGGSQSNRVLFDRSIGITVRYGSRSAPGRVQWSVFRGRGREYRQMLSDSRILRYWRIPIILNF